MRKLVQRQAVDRPRERRSRCRRASTCRRREELDEYKQFSMCINCMLCYAACPIYGLDPKFIGPAAIALAQRYNLDNRDEGARQRMEVLSEHEGIWGCTFVGECTKVCPEARRSGRRHPALQADGGARVDEVVLHAEGGVMSWRVPTTPTITRAGCGRHVSTYWWLESRSYFAFILREASCLFVAWFVVYLLLLVRAVLQGRGQLPGSSWPGRRRRAILALNVVSFAFLVFHAVTFFDAAPQAMVVHVGAPRVPGTR